VVVAAAALVACGGARATPAPPPAPPAPAAPVRAAAGDTVYLIEHVVRPDRREQFERFLTTSYWPAVRFVARTDSGAARVLRQTRVLYPARPNEDGTFTYVFLTDPVVRGETYNILELLRRVHTPQETERRYRELTESWARPFSSRPFVQPPYPAQLPAAPGAGSGGRPE
jgi:hypothetical protein